MDCTVKHSSFWRNPIFALPQEELRGTAAEAGGLTADCTPMKQGKLQKTCDKGEIDARCMSAAELAQTVEAADVAIREARQLAAENVAMASRLGLAEEQVWLQFKFGALLKNSASALMLESDVTLYDVSLSKAT